MRVYLMIQTLFVCGNSCIIDKKVTYTTCVCGKYHFKLTRYKWKCTETYTVTFNIPGSTGPHIKHIKKGTRKQRSNNYCMFHPI